MHHLVSHIRQVCQEGFRKNRIPAFILQGFAASLLVLYFMVEPVRNAFQVIGDLKSETDPWFAMVTTALFAGVIPWTVQAFRGRFPKGRRLYHLLFLALYWAIQGFAVDTLYHWQENTFGNGRDLQTLAVKVLIDQFPFNLFWGTPNSVVWYGWRDADFSWRRFREQNPMPRLINRYVTIQVSVWIIWIPAVMMIYTLPLDLQIPLFNLVICFFSLLLATVSRKG